MYTTLTQIMKGCTKRLKNRLVLKIYRADGGKKLPDANFRARRPACGKQ